MSPQLQASLHTRFAVAGVPVPQGALRRNPNGPGMYESNTAHRSWRAELVDAARYAWCGAPPHLGPVEVSATFVFPRPRSHYGTGRNAAELKPAAPLAHTVKPDLDKLQRALGDALVLAGVLRDDALITSWVVSKVYGGHPGAYVAVHLLETAQ